MTITIKFADNTLVAQLYISVPSFPSVYHHQAQDQLTETKVDEKEQEEREIIPIGMEELALSPPFHVDPSTCFIYLTWYKRQ